MPDLYAKVIHEDKMVKKKKDWRICCIIAAAIAGLVILAIVVSQPLICRFVLYPKFVSAVSDSTLYAYENDSLRADLAEESVHVSGENAYSFFKSLTVGPPDKLVWKTPVEEPDLKLDYGNGSTLSLWEVSLKEPETKKAMRVLFEDGEGARISFYTDSISVERVSRWLMSDQDGNEVWAE